MAHLEGSTDLSRVVVYTAVSGSYDSIGGVRPGRCDYVCYCDHPVSASGWNARPLPDLRWDDTRKARHIKLLPHRFLGDYDVSIWIDGNIDVLRDPWRLALSVNDEVPMLCYRHPERRSLREEAEACVRKGKDDPVRIREQLECYETLGLPSSATLIESNVLVRRHNDPRIVAAMELWWNEVATRSKRDQLAFPFVAWKTDLPYGFMGDAHTRGRSRYFQLRRHSGSAVTLRTRFGNWARRMKSFVLNHGSEY